MQTFLFLLIELAVLFRPKMYGFETSNNYHTTIEFRASNTATLHELLKVTAFGVDTLFQLFAASSHNICTTP